MRSSHRSYAIADLPWTEVAAHLKHDRRLILPVGACDQSGPHLPVGAGTCVAEALARDLSQEFGVLRAPTFHYGVNLPGEETYAGTAALRAKTLHRALNELLVAWAAQGFDEFICITANAHGPHAEAIATLRAPGRARAGDRGADVDLSTLLDGKRRPEHAGEALTSLLLHLRPDVRARGAGAGLHDGPRDRRESSSAGSSSASRWPAAAPWGSPRWPRRRRGAPSTSTSCRRSA